MSEKKKNTEKKQKKSPLSIILILFLMLTALLGVGLYNNTKKPAKTSLDDQKIQHKTDSQHKTGSQYQTDSYDLDIEALSTPRILGDVNAPVKISEHSSFTCMHCGNFHQTNFKKIKQEYIDTGIAYIIFDDFPLNRSDLLIGAIARCVPEQAYFNFIQLVFETQEEWINKNDYIDYIKQNAKLAGADSSKIEQCYESKDLREIIAERREAAHKDYGISSTPTLVINDTEVIGGMRQYKNIKAIIDNAYEESRKAEAKAEKELE